MSTIAMPVQHVPVRREAQNRHKQVRPVKPARMAHAPWREPMSVRQANALFEAAVLPELTRRLERLFHGLDDNEREEAVQDCACQALEAYRALKLYMAGNAFPGLANASAALAEHAAAQYLAGARFASPRAESRL